MSCSIQGGPCIYMYSIAWINAWFWLASKCAYTPCIPHPSHFENNSCPDTPAVYTRISVLLLSLQYIDTYARVCVSIIHSYLYILFCVAHAWDDIFVIALTYNLKKKKKNLVIFLWTLAVFWDDISDEEVQNVKCTVRSKDFEKKYYFSFRACFQLAQTVSVWNEGYFRHRNVWWPAGFILAAIEGSMNLLSLVKFEAKYTSLHHITLHFKSLKSRMNSDVTLPVKRNIH